MTPEAQIIRLERRARRRLQTQLSASVVFAEGGRMDCTVVNISPMGAMLVFAQPTILPDEFKIVIPECLFECECEIRHRTTDRAGVLFTTNRREALARFQ